MQMFVSSATTEQVLRNSDANEFQRWYRNDVPADQPDGKLAFQRLRQPLFTPFIMRGFKMERHDKIYAIGSCFARGVENALVGQQMQVLSRATEFDAFPAVNNELKLGFTNKYNTYSIYNELRWALDPEAEFVHESVVDIGSGVYYDPHTNPALELAGLAETLRRRSIMQSITRRIVECRVVIITLGLAEVWRDRIAETFINTTPLPEAVRRHPDRYEFHVSSFAENLANLAKIHHVINHFGHSDTQIVVTVSPVPLMATFSNDDIVVANSYSKSVLRAVAQEWASAHQNVHYFPSYEIVLNSDRATSWLEDLRHVRGEVVQHIMKVFLDSYLRETVS